MPSRNPAVLIAAFGLACVDAVPAAPSASRATAAQPPTQRLSYSDLDILQVTSDSQADFLGRDLAVGDFNNDGDADFAVSAWSDDDGGSEAGAMWVVYGPVSADFALGDRSTDAKRSGLNVWGMDASGWSMASGDLDGDGHPEVISGCRACETAAAYANNGQGVVVAWDGDQTLSDGDWDAWAADWFAAGTSGTTMKFGAEVAVGDGDGDSANGNELAIGISMDNSAGTYRGEVRVLDTDTKSTLVAYHGDVNHLQIGETFDFYGDGASGDRLVIGARLRKSGSARRVGAAFFMDPLADASSCTSSDCEVGTDGYEASGEAYGDEAGYRVAALGDLDGDGVDEVMVSAPYNDDGSRNGGAVYIVPGDVTADFTLSDTTTLKLVSSESADRIGMAIAAGPDFDGDGLPELLIGAPKATDTNTRSTTGVMCVVSSAELDTATGGTWLGEVDILDSSLTTVCVAGKNKWGNFGTALATADLDDDGVDDVVVGADQDSEAGWNAGAVYVVSGQSIIDEAGW